MAITTEQVKELRNITGVSIMQCKKALEEAAGDIEKAEILLRKFSKKAADKKADRELKAGTVATYVHGDGAVGAMVELLCETDFVSKNEEFKNLARDIAMHVVAAAPQFVRESEISEKDTEKAKEIFSEEAEGKPEEIKAKIIEGKLSAYFAEKTLMKQAYIKNPDKAIEQLVEEAIQKFGEKTEIGRIARFSIKN
jgi:elongation factor Ts